MREGLKIFVAFMSGFFFAAGFVDYFGGTLLKAIVRYETCIVDGGEKDHCIKKYLLLNREIKP